MRNVSNNLKFVIGMICLSVVSCHSLKSTGTEKLPIENNHPNIIYILADDLGIGDLTIYNEDGKIPTPNLDQLGREGMRFNDAHTSSSVCTPTRYGILTGRYNWRTPLKEFVLWGNSPSLIQKDRLSVAQLLKNKGYKTANIGKWHLGLNWTLKNDAADFNAYTKRTDRVGMASIDFSQPLKSGTLDLGFDYSFMIPASLNMPPFVYLENDKPTQIPTKKTERKRKEFPFSSWIKGDVADDFVHEQVLPTLVDKSVEFIKENANKEQPFFLYLPLPSPHNPVLPIDPWKGTSNINGYADFVIMTDALMGRIFETLEAQGIENNTMVIFTSDNGCSSTADIPTLKKKRHNPSYIYSGLKGSYLEGGHRVPFLVKWPGVVPANSQNDATICTTDFIATCADLVNYSLKDNEGEDSYSMLPLLKGEKSYKRTSTVHHSKTGVFAIRQGDWKLILLPNSGVGAKGQPAKIKKQLPDYLLYNLENDVKERNNLAEEYPDKLEELKNILIQQIKQGRSTPGKPQQNDDIDFEWVQTAFMNQ